MIPHPAKHYFRFLPLAAIALLSLAFYLLGLSHYFTVEAFTTYHETLKTSVALHPFLSALIFIGTYAFLTALALPVAIFLTLLGGVLFSQPWCTLYGVIGASLGSILLFLAMRPAVSNGMLVKKEKPVLKKMRRGFSENAASYLLFLHFIHLLPFWVINLAAAFFNVRFLTFAWTTVVGVIPTIFVYAEAGRGMEAAIEQHAHFSIDAVFNTQTTVALVGLAVLALFPILLRRKRRK